MTLMNITFNPQVRRFIRRSQAMDLTWILYIIFWNNHEFKDLTHQWIQICCLHNIVLENRILYRCQTSNNTGTSNPGQQICELRQWYVLKWINPPQILKQYECDERSSLAFTRNLPSSSVFLIDLQEVHYYYLGSNSFCLSQNMLTSILARLCSYRSTVAITRCHVLRRGHSFQPKLCANCVDLLIVATRGGNSCAHQYQFSMSV